jgi:hypothetical protein
LPHFEAAFAGEELSAAALPFTGDSRKQAAANAAVIAAAARVIFNFLFKPIRLAKKISPAAFFAPEAMPNVKIMPANAEKYRSKSMERLTYIPDDKQKE